MAPLSTTRTIFELRVGSTHTIEVLLQIRLSDIAWWNSNLRDHERQLHKLIGRRVLPSECRTEIEADLAKMQGAHANNDTKKKRGKVVIGEANLKKKANKDNGKGKKRGKAKKETKASKKQKLAEKKAMEANDTESKEKKLKLLREPGKWVMGKSIQICYMMEDIEKSSATTLIFRTKANIPDNATTDPASAEETKSQPTETEEDKQKMVPLATFRSWKKLPKRLSLWVFQFDPDKPSILSVSEGGGFPRPELLPMSDIFRSTGENE